MHHNLNVPMSIVISGVEGKTYWDIVVNKAKMGFVLMSYHYLQSKKGDFLKERIEENPHVKVFIDSGAHTFLTNEKFLDMPMSFWEDYLEKYTSWLIQNKDYIFACANLDLESIVGNEQVDEWNDKYFKKVEEAGIEVCYIWHSPRGETGWEEMCRKHSYIGLSIQNDTDTTLQKLMKKIKVAQKYNTRVHGMALTKTDILVRVPFFSADSTTWLVGQQYGELNWFDGRKMRRLGKTEWRRNYKTKLLKEPFNADWDRLINGMGGRGDTYELLRLNLITYKLMEEHIRQRNFSRMYWMGGNNTMLVSKNQTNEINLDLPPYEWYVDENEEYPDLDKYLKNLQISPNDYSREEAVNILFFHFLLLKDTDNHIDEFDDETLTTYASQLSKSVIESRAGAIEYLTNYYRENVQGLRNDFRGENSLAPKEREIYVEEDEFSTIDLSSSDIEMGLGINPQADDMPEVTLLDEELRKQDIVPVRDGKGRFIKGQKKVRKPKNIYSDKMPVLNCNTCYKAGDCEMYKPGYVCAYKKMFKRFNTRNMDDIIDAMTSMANFNLERMSRAMMFETMDGGMVTAEVTGLIDQNMRILNQIKDLQQSKAVVSQKRVIREDGTEETVTQLNVNPQGEGILSKIFGMTSKANDDEDKDKFIDVDYKE